MDKSNDNKKPTIIIEVHTDEKTIYGVQLKSFGLSFTEAIAVLEISKMQLISSMTKKDKDQDSFEIH